MRTVILYQMGKVGSSTLKGSLAQNNVRALHIHRYYFSNTERTIGLKLFLLRIKKIITYNFFIKRKKVKIITFYRDPLTRNISSFFQNLDMYFSENELKNISYEQLKTKFNSANNIHETPNNWFDLEFNRKLKVNIYKHPIDKEKGFTVFSKGNIEFFVCTTDKINNLEKELGGFLEIKNFKIINKNVGYNKWYKELYKEFKERYKPSTKMLNSLYGSKTIHHFYTQEVIDKLLNKWKK